MTKFTKSQVRYRENGIVYKCKSCVWFEFPEISNAQVPFIRGRDINDDEVGGCVQVEGGIRAGGTCILWQTFNIGKMAPLRPQALTRLQGIRGQ